MYFSKKSLEMLQAEYETMSERCQRLLDAYAAYKYTDARAQEFAMHGFARRLQTLVRCVINTFELLPPEKANLPTREERHDAEINIQAFVFNAFGSMDNLAWIWLTERGLTQKDGSAVPSTWVGLSKKNRFVRSSFSLEFRKYLQSLDQWFDHLENFRHSLAHRIPLYIPPYVVLDSKLARYKELEERMMKTTTLEEYQCLSAEQTALAEFRPCMTHSFGENSKPVVFHPQLLGDFKTIEQLAWKMLSELYAPLPRRTNRLIVWWTKQWSLIRKAYTKLGWR